MLYKYILFAFLIQFGILFSCTSIPNHVKKFELLYSLDNAKSTPQIGQWLSSYSEKNQTLENYIDSKPNKINRTNQYLYITTIGEMDKQQKDVLKIANTYFAALDTFWKQHKHIDNAASLYYQSVQCLAVP